MTENLPDPWASLQALRAEPPLVQNITNFVAMDLAANVLLALGASPAMAHAPEEAEEFVKISSSLTINIGTLTGDWVKAMHKAVDVAERTGTPWVLDPVAAGATSYRTRVASDLSTRGPAVIRGNASEIMAIAGSGSGGRGVDSLAESFEALDAAKALAADRKCVVLITGAVDYATNGRQTLAIEGGSPLATRVTALGCALTCSVGAALGVEKNPLAASALAASWFNAAGTRAARLAGGPASFRSAFLDALYNLEEGDLADLIKAA